MAKRGKAQRGKGARVTSRRRSAPRGRGRLRVLKVIAALGLLAGLVGGVYVAWLDLQVRAAFEGKRWALPARIYARPLELYPGLVLDPADLVAELERLGYRRAATSAASGTYARAGERVTLHTRPFRFWDGAEPARRLDLRFDGERLTRLGEVAGGEVALARLEPEEIGRIHPAHFEDRVLVRLAEVPETLVAALMAVEDRKFRTHSGVDPRAILRALWSNLRAGRTVQGGSTLTQQLIKNLYLSSEQTLTRKLNEALMALLLEWHYGKDEILEAYLNEVHLGQHGRRAVHGFGLAARFYFHRPLQELDTHHLALLVGLVRGASYYDPRRHPERARERRDRVLGILAEQGVITAADRDRARARPLEVVPDRGFATSPYPAYMDLVRRQLQRDYREADLRSEGLRVFTTLDPRVQGAAEEALSRRLARLEGGPAGADGLQGAVVVVSPTSGEVLAAVGGREPRAGGFNRALDARRPIGSLVKPAVYLAALERDGGYTPIALVRDEPLELHGADGQTWRPGNYDGEAHGRVTLGEALVHSYNLATVHLGLELGLPKVVHALGRLGLERQPELYPSLLLGAVEMSPLEVAGMYQTLASGGFRMPLRAIREVTGPDGEPLTRYRLRVEAAFEPGPVYLVNTLLTEVVARGTARSAGRRLGERGPFAGKTGTTDDLRDSWFAGFGGDRLAVVWVGRDDNRPAGLSGASGALPVWTDLMETTAAQPLDLVAPETVHWVPADPASGEQVDPACDKGTPTPFLKDLTPPLRPCPRRGGLFGF